MKTNIACVQNYYWLIGEGQQERQGKPNRIPIDAELELWMSETIYGWMIGSTFNSNQWPHPVQFSYYCLPNNQKMDSFQNIYGHNKLTIIIFWPWSWRGQWQGDRGMASTQATGSALEWAGPERDLSWRSFLRTAAIRVSIRVSISKMSRNRERPQLTAWWWWPSPGLAPPTRQHQKANILALAHSTHWIIHSSLKFCKSWFGHPPILAS